MAGADKSVAADDIIDRNVPANLIARDSTGAPLVAHDPSQTMMLREHGADSTAAEIVLKKGVEEKILTGPAIDETTPSIADERVAPLPATREDDDTRAAKRAIIHEWENWSALHSDELGIRMSANIFSGICRRKSPNRNFVDYNCDAVRNWLKDYRYA